MNCPNCKQLMVVLELDKVEIDYCMECEGIWLDEGELELLLEGNAEKNRFLKSFGIENKSEERKKKCPICRKKMDKISFPGISEGQKIIIDGCPDNHGIWFDRGELKPALAMGGMNRSYKVYGLLKDVFNNRIED